MLEKVIQRPPDYRTIVGQPSHDPSIPQSVNRPTMYPVQAQSHYSQYRPPSIAQTPSYMHQSSFQRPIEPQCFSISPQTPSIPERRPAYHRQPTEHESLPAFKKPETALSLPIEDLELDKSGMS